MATFEKLMGNDVAPRKEFIVAGAYALTRALERASTGWLLLAWSFVGFGFLTKMLQALLVAPAFALVYLICAPTTFRRRFVQSVYGFIALVISACGRSAMRAPGRCRRRRR